jgi:hypothetical protein
MRLEVVFDDHAHQDLAHECEPIALRHLIAGKPVNGKITRRRCH